MSETTTPISATAKCCWCASSLVWVKSPSRSSDWVAEGHWWCQTAACRLRQRQWAFARQVTEWSNGTPKTTHEYLFVPLPKQTEFLSIQSTYKLYGGAAGPGKSHAARWGLYRLARAIPNFRALLLRESFGELEQTHFADMEVEQDVVGGKFLKGDHMMIFPDNKSRIIGGHFEDKKTIRRYLSTNYDVIVCDEGSQYDPDSLLELSTRARTSKEAAKPWVGDGQMWICTNPGGPASSTLKDFFITHSPDFERYPKLRDKYRPSDWVYTPALLDDNPYSAESYATKLAVLQGWRYEQLRNGDWDVGEGTFFEDFSKATHVREIGIPTPINGVIEAIDWGYTSPGCWIAVAHVGDNHWHVIGEWKFKQHTPEEVAAGILDRRNQLGIGKTTYVVADPSMFAKQRGESIAETMERYGVRNIRPGDNERELGWMRLMAAFRMSSSGKPWLTYEPTCVYSIRSIPGLLADKNNPEDVDTKLDDHAADAARYFVQSRPMFRTPNAEDQPPAPNTWGWWRRFHQQQEQPTGVLA